MKRLLTLFLFFSLFVVLTPSVSGQVIEDNLPPVCPIIGGAAVVKTRCNPNGVSKIRVLNQKYDGSFAYDTLEQVLYQYDRSLSIGNRWQVFAERRITDTMTAWKSRHYAIAKNTTDLIINARSGSLTVSDSVVLMFNHVWFRDHEWNIYVTGAAKFWICDLILTSNFHHFEDGNGKAENFPFPTQRQCIEFFNSDFRNDAYNSDFFTTALNKVWKITVRFNYLTGKYSVVKTGFN